MYDYLNEFFRTLPDNSIVIPDQGGNLVWTMQSAKIKNNHKLFTNYGNSSMGFALPCAIGAAIGSPNKKVFCIDGDGGFQMNIQELQTIKHYNLPVKIFIINNNCYGIIKQFQALLKSMARNGMLKFMMIIYLEVQHLKLEKNLKIYQLPSFNSQTT